MLEWAGVVVRVVLNWECWMWLSQKPRLIPKQNGRDGLQSKDMSLVPAKCGVTQHVTVLDPFRTKPSIPYGDAGKTRLQIDKKCYHLLLPEP